MTETKKKLKYFNDLTEKKKDKILEYIREKEISISKASSDLKISTNIINKIFAERFGKKN